MKKMAKIALFGLGLTLLVTALPAAAQNQSLTSFADSLGPHVYYQAEPYPFDLWQIAPSFRWSGDLNQLWVCRTCPNLPSPMALSPLVSYFGANDNPYPGGPAGNSQYLIYINFEGQIELFRVDSNGARSAYYMYGMEPCKPACNPDGKSLAGFSDAFGSSVFYTGMDGSVYHWLGNPPANITDFGENMSAGAGVTPNSACGVVNSALSAFSDTRSSPNNELVFYVDSFGHLCELAESDLFHPTSVDLTAFCQVPGTPCGSGAPQPMLKSPLTGFTDPGGVHVFYLDALGHPNEFVLTSNEVSNLNLWNSVVCPPQYVTILGRRYLVTYSCNAPAAVADSLTSFTNAFGPQAFYVDTNGHVNQLNLQSNTRKDLTASFGGAPAVQAKLFSSAYNLCTVGTSLSSLGVDNQQGEVVYYIGNDWHIWELASSDGSAWIAADLTQNFHTPNASVLRTCPA